MARPHAPLLTLGGTPHGQKKQVVSLLAGLTSAWFKSPLPKFPSALEAGLDSR